jgi:alkanesulfonate monooxygenase SsuD/methylene tetrahydromethanopterin reductase-like flavin-dependent oxidoreductase (luciferase family)
VLPFRDPVTFARQCATLDYLSDGRLLPAVGVGREDAPEWQATVRDPSGRGKRADEALEVMTRLWASDAADFDGEHYSLANASISPRPKQSPLPLWLGGASKAAIRRTARFGHGWLAPLQAPDEAGATVRAIREESARVGRPIPDDHYGATILFRIGAPVELPTRATTDPEIRRRIERVRAVGDAGNVLDRLCEFRAVGITKFIAIPLASTAQDMMEQTRLLDREVIPHAND